MKDVRSQLIRFLSVTTVLFGVVGAAFAGDDAPGWLLNAAGANVPTYDKDVPAVVLYDEEQVSFSPDGKLVTIDNFAIRILSREGREFAIARADYLANYSKVRDIEAWLIRPDGSVKVYDKKSVIDAISDRDDIYNEARFKAIDAVEDSNPGYVFGYTTVSEDSPLFYQDQWIFQSGLPTLVSRYSLTLPAGWTASSITFNAPEIKPSISGSTYLWQMSGLAPIRPEPMSPKPINLAARIAVNYAPPAGQNSADRVFNSWGDVSRWTSAMYDPQVVIDDAVAAKARELTASAKTELEMIRAIGTYVQNMQYIVLDVGLGFGNGMRPRPSNEVLNRGYADCKNKANLMRALLKAVKIDSYPVPIYSGDASFVREQWASPRQFNHCIIAVKVSDATVAATVLRHEKLGRLLIFDATDPYTPVGDLPSYLQGSYGLIAAGDLGGLSRMPVTPPDTDLLERSVDIDMTGLGGIKGTISEHANGQVSTMFRSQMRDLSANDYRKSLEGWLTRGATGAQLVNVKSSDRFAESKFDLDVAFEAPLYGQLMQDRLLVFRPAIVGRQRDVYLTDPKRTTPVELDGFALRETATFNLPAGFAVDETPDPVTLETDFGRYTTKYDIKDGKLLFMRTISMKRMLIPVERYEAVKSFFSKVRDSDQSPVVVVRK
jgi:transglutaminase-like putative cysteine protease